VFGKPVRIQPMKNFGFFPVQTSGNRCSQANLC
jgi:hypothetical protein